MDKNKLFVQWIKYEDLITKKLCLYNKTQFHLTQLEIVHS